MPNIQPTSVFKVLADVNRSKMVMLLGEKEHTVGTLEKSLGLSQSSTSQHLKILHSAGLVSFRKFGNFRYYSLRSAELKKAMNYFDRLWDDGFELMKSNLEK